MNDVGSEMWLLIQQLPQVFCPHLRYHVVAVFKALNLVHTVDQSWPRIVEDLVICL